MTGEWVGGGDWEKAFDPQPGDVWERKSDNVQVTVGERSTNYTSFARVDNGHAGVEKTPEFRRAFKFIRPK